MKKNVWKLFTFDIIMLYCRIISVTCCVHVGVSICKLYEVNHYSLRLRVLELALIFHTTIWYHNTYREIPLNLWDSHNAIGSRLSYSIKVCGKKHLYRSETSENKAFFHDVINYWQRINWLMWFIAFCMMKSGGRTTEGQQSLLLPVCHIP